jgi:hypothetical protein
MIAEASLQASDSLTPTLVSVANTNNATFVELVQTVEEGNSSFYFQTVYDMNAFSLRDKGNRLSREGRLSGGWFGLFALGFIVLMMIGSEKREE